MIIRAKVSLPPTHEQVRNPLHGQPRPPSSIVEKPGGLRRPARLRKCALARTYEAHAPGSPYIDTQLFIVPFARPRCQDESVAIWKKNPPNSEKVSRSCTIFQNSSLESRL
jgi:hypothetical protein